MPCSCGRQAIFGFEDRQELISPIGMRGKPHTVVSDNGMELTSSAIVRGWQERRIECHDIAPGRPIQNGFNIARYFRKLGQASKFVRNDAVGVSDLVHLNPRAVVISPGPYTPLPAGVAIDLAFQVLSSSEFAPAVGCARLGSGSDGVWREAFGIAQRQIPAQVAGHREL